MIHNRPRMGILPQSESKLFSDLNQFSKIKMRQHINGSPEVSLNAHELSFGGAKINAGICIKESGRSVVKSTIEAKKKFDA